ncbi:MAG TPA: nitrilase-related carbon-nitrogen hydrolase [candidate division Zixibacteria bacterium]|nr:nitrilase-related carbon-nitrogen hydrolase [candidate division Zixibacteria bacterium]
MYPYDVALIQSNCHVVRRRDERDELIKRNLKRIGELVGFASNRVGEIKLAVTGEYSLFGQFRPRSLEEWIDMTLPIPNFATDLLAEICVRMKLYMTGHFLERHPEFPGRYFNTTVIVDPAGKIVLAYRKHNGPNNLNTSYTGPGDIYERFVEVFGEDALFPVVDTPIGRLGVLVCGDIQYPEVARALALKGAEILIHPTAEIYRRSHAGWEAMRVARAAENKAYLLSCTTAAFLGTDRPEFGYRGRSQIISPDGDMLAIVEGPGEAVISASVDIDRLRWRKTRVAASGHNYNPTVLCRADLYAREYRKALSWPTGVFQDKPLSSTKDCQDIAEQIIARQVAAGRLRRPSDAGGSPA